MSMAGLLEKIDGLGPKILKKPQKVWNNEHCFNPLFGLKDFFEDCKRIIVT